MTKSEKSEIVKAAIRANPKAANRALAKQLNYEYPELWPTIETARDAVRYWKGKKGQRNLSGISDNSLVNYEIKSNAKILLFDLETAPMKAYIWSKWANGVHDDQIITDWFVLTWSAKWLFGDKVYQAKVTKKEAKAQNDKRIIKSLWNLIDEADIIIAHNLKKFDRKKANTRFLLHGLGLPSPYLIIDTLLHARRQFAITSNRLDYIAHNFLGLEGKMETPKGLWWRAVEGDIEAIQMMADYCDQDVRVLEDVYLYLRPYIQPHPNVGLFNELDEEACTACGGKDLKMIGDYYTNVNIYTAYRCGDCGSISRSRVTTTPIRTKRALKVPVAR